MSKLELGYLNRAEIYIFITTLAYFLMNGAQIFETAILVPRWSGAPPSSFALFQGSLASNLKVFWIVTHCLHEITFVLALIVSWKVAPIRNWLLCLFAAHMGVRVWTLVYFAPAILEFSSMAKEALALSSDPAAAANVFGDVDVLKARADQWRRLNYLRVGLFLAVSLGLLPLFWRIMALKVK